MVRIIKRYQLSNGRIQKNFTQILCTFMSMCSKCTAFNFCMVDALRIQQDSFALFTEFFNKMVADAFYLRERTVLIGASIRLNQ